MKSIDELSRSVEAERLKIRNIPGNTEQTRLISLVENVSGKRSSGILRSGYRYKLNKQRWSYYFNTLRGGSC